VHYQYITASWPARYDTRSRRSLFSVSPWRNCYQAAQRLWKCSSSLWRPSSARRPPTWVAAYALLVACATLPRGQSGQC